MTPQAASGGGHLSAPAPGSDGKGTVLIVVAVALSLYAGLCKVLLFRAFEYVGNDLYSFLDMTWSWLYAGRLLYENAYGDHTAIHSFYLLLAFSPLTIPFGAYGLFAGLVLLELVAAVRVATARGLSVAARAALLLVLLSPVAYFAFDDIGWGFHPELCYPPLALLLALDLSERRFKRAALSALAMVLVKEDGAVLLAGVLIAYFAGRLWSLGRGARDERRRLLRFASASLAIVAAVFLLNMALLWAAGRSAPDPRVIASLRVSHGLGAVWRTLSGQALPERGTALREGARFYAFVALLLLLPLGTRLARGLALLALSVPGVLLTLLVSAGHYKFAMMAWAPRVATLLAVVLACLVFATRKERSLRSVAALVLASWALQLALLNGIGYSLRRRADALALASGRGYTVATLPSDELQFLRCVAGRLPRGMPVSPIQEAYPLFHHQSIVFQSLEAHAWHPARLRVIPAAWLSAARTSGLCPGPVVGELALEVECPLLPQVASCGLLAGRP